MAVYLLRCGRTLRWKIGYTKHPDAQARLRHIRSASPTELHLVGLAPEGTRQDEAALHKRCRPWRMPGKWSREWYSADGEVGTVWLEFYPGHILAALPHYDEAVQELDSLRQKLEREQLRSRRWQQEVRAERLADHVIDAALIEDFANMAMLLTGSGPYGRLGSMRHRWQHPGGKLSPVMIAVMRNAVRMMAGEIERRGLQFATRRELESRGRAEYAACTET